MRTFPDGGIMSISANDLKGIFETEPLRNASMAMLIPAFEQGFYDYLKKHAWDSPGPQYFRVRKPEKSEMLLTCNGNVPVLVLIEYKNLLNKTGKKSLIGMSVISLFDFPADRKPTGADTVFEEQIAFMNGFRTHLESKGWQELVKEGRIFFNGIPSKTMQKVPRRIRKFYGIEDYEIGL